MKCLNCGSEKVTGALAVEDDGAYPAGNHKVGDAERTQESDRDGQFSPPGTRVPRVRLHGAVR